MKRVEKLHSKYLKIRVNFFIHYDDKKCSDDVLISR